MKILLLDIETAPHIAYVWGLWNENIPLARLVKPGYTLCWAAKWLGEKEIMFDSIMQSSPRAMVRRIYKLINEADAVIHYNGKKFDIPTLNKEFVQYGMKPPAPYKQIDLYTVVRQNFKYPSNKLDYVAQALKCGAKVKHKGMELWTECMSRDKAAWEEMEKYNKEDVALLERVYVKLLPWINNHPNYGLYTDPDRPTCTNCPDGVLQKRGYSYTNVGKYQRYQCKSCGRWCRGRRSINSDNQKENVTTTAR